MQIFLLLLTFLVSRIDVALADDNDYEEFLPSNEPDQSEWTLDDVMTGNNMDLFDNGQFEYPSESYNQDLSPDFVSFDKGCSSAWAQTPEMLSPRGDDDFCGSNLGVQELPVVIPNLSTLNLASFCPNKFPEVASQLVCASDNPANMQSSLFGISLMESKAGVFLSFLNPTLPSNVDICADDKY